MSKFDNCQTMDITGTKVYFLCVFNFYMNIRFDIKIYSH